MKSQVDLRFFEKKMFMPWLVWLRGLNTGL